jgi:hypothetical protein
VQSAILATGNPVGSCLEAEKLTDCTKFTIQ